MLFTALAAGAEEGQRLRPRLPLRPPGLVRNDEPCSGEPRSGGELPRPNVVSLSQMLFCAWSDDEGADRGAGRGGSSPNMALGGRSGSGQILTLANREGPQSIRVRLASPERIVARRLRIDVQFLRAWIFDERELN